MRKHISVIIIIIFLLPGVPGFLLLPRPPGMEREGEYIEQIGDDASMNWTTKVLRLKGIGFGPERVKNLGRRKILAKRAAKLDAYRNLIEALKGVQVISVTTVENMMLASDSIQTRASGMVKGMRVVEVEYMKDGGCEITVEVDIDKDGRFLLTILDTGEYPVTDNYPRFDWAALQKDLEKTKARLVHSQLELDKTKKKLREKEDLINNNRMELKGRSHYATSAAGETRHPNEPDRPAQWTYTGLLVDARGLELKPALAPSILNPKQEKMYGIGVIPPRAARGSTVDYLPGNIEHAKKHKKIYNRPLIIKGIRAINKSDIMIGEEDARKLVLILDLLKQGKVVILIQGN